jgi:hypothetical protein
VVAANNGNPQTPQPLQPQKQQPQQQPPPTVKQKFCFYSGIAAPWLGGFNMGLAATGNPAVVVTGPATFFFYALVRTPICL